MVPLVARSNDLLPHHMCLEVRPRPEHLLAATIVLVSNSSTDSGITTFSSKLIASDQAKILSGVQIHEVKW